MNDASQDKTLFGVVAEGLEKFRMEVEGGSGRKIRAIENRQGPIPELVRGLLAGLEQALTWLYKEVIVKIEPCLTSADAFVATLEVAVYSLEGLGRELQFTEMSELQGLPNEIQDGLKEVGGHIGKAGDAMDYGLKIVHLLPRPEELGETRTTLEALLGSRVNPQLVDKSGKPVPGSLEQLLTAINAVKSEQNRLTVTT